MHELEMLAGGGGKDIVHVQGQGCRDDGEAVGWSIGAGQ